MLVFGIPLSARAARRLNGAFRRDHHHLGVILTGDALSRNAPHIRGLQEAHPRFILFEVGPMAEIHQGIAFGFRRPTLKSLMGVGTTAGRNDAS